MVVEGVAVLVEGEEVGLLGEACGLVVEELSLDGLVVLGEEEEVVGVA